MHPRASCLAAGRARVLTPRKGAGRACGPVPESAGPLREGRRPGLRSRPGARPAPT